jgi:tRNA(Ile)-lysidine synthase
MPRSASDPNDVIAALTDALNHWPQGALIIACSGGIDSLSLLHALAHTVEARKRGLHAVHIDHGLHPSSHLWTEHVQQFAQSLNVSLHVQRVTVASNQGVGLEAAARQSRYAALHQTMQSGDIVITAHHADDQAETLLMRLLRASGPEGIAAMRSIRPFGKGWLARPWLQVTQTSIRAYALKHKLSWIDDPSNQNTHHDRNYLRQNVMPLIRKRWPHAAYNFARSAALLGNMLQHHHKQLDQEVNTREVNTDRTIDASRLHTLPPEQLGAILRHWYISLRLPPPPSTAIGSIARMLNSPRIDGQFQVCWPGAQWRLWRGVCYALPPRITWPTQWEENWDGSHPIALPDGGSLIIQGNLSTMSFTVRSQTGGARMDLHPKRPSQRVKHLLQAKGIPPWERNCAPWLWQKNELWAVGDWFLSHHFQSWLSAHHANYQWIKPR